MANDVMRQCPTSLKDQLILRIFKKNGYGLTCSICDESYRNTEILKDHLTRIHDSDVQLICISCKFAVHYSVIPYHMKLYHHSSGKADLIAPEKLGNIGFKGIVEAISQMEDVSKKSNSAKVVEVVELLSDEDEIDVKKDNIEIDDVEPEIINEVDNVQQDEIIVDEKQEVIEKIDVDVQKESNLKIDDVEPEVDVDVEEIIDETTEEEGESNFAIFELDESSCENTKDGKVEEILDASSDSSDVIECISSGEKKKSNQNLGWVYTFGKRRQFLTALDMCDEDDVYVRIEKGDPEDQSHKCLICNNLVRFSFGLENHLRKEHSGRYTLYCRPCEDIVPFTGLEDHMKTNHPTKFMLTFISFRSICQLQEILDNISSSTPIENSENETLKTFTLWQFTIEPITFLKPRSINQQLTLRIDSLEGMKYIKHRCKICHQDMKSMKDIKSHLILNHKKNSLVCDVCNVSMEVQDVSHHMHSSHSESCSTFTTQNMPVHIEVAEKKPGECIFY